MLQRLTEDLEYSELLDRAARCDSTLEQMCLVASFSVSSYSTTVHRTAKPFNPLLGETYELDRLDEYGYRSICEQVRRQLSCPVCYKVGRSSILSLNTSKKHFPGCLPPPAHEAGGPSVTLG